MPSCLHHAVNSSDPKGTLSDVMTSGIPCVANIWVRCVVAVAAEHERVTWTSGYFDVSSTATKRYSPDGNVPQWSIWTVCHTCFGGSVIWRGSGGGVGPTTWQPRHWRTYLSA